MEIFKKQIRIDEHVSRQHSLIPYINKNLDGTTKLIMDDYNIDLYGVPTPYIMIKDYTEEGMRVLHEADLIEEICGAKIISYKYDMPVENSFGLFK